MELVTPNDTIVDMFCGVGPYSIACGNAEQIYSIDINPDGIALLKENIVLNNLEHKIIPIFRITSYNVCYTKLLRILFNSTHKISK